MELEASRDIEDAEFVALRNVIRYNFVTRRISASCRTAATNIFLAICCFGVYASGFEARGDTAQRWQFAFLADVSLHKNIGVVGMDLTQLQWDHMCLKRCVLLNASFPRRPRSPSVRERKFINSVKISVMIVQHEVRGQAIDTVTCHGA